MKKNTITALTYSQMVDAKNKIQRAAIKAILTQLGYDRKTVLNMATGGGKTRLAWKLIFEHPDFNTVLFMVPKISLVDQTIQEWEEQCAAAGVSFDYRTAYSKGDLSTAEELDQWLSEPSDRKKVVFAVYNTVGVSEDSKESSIFSESTIPFDLAIYDECHRVAGKEMGLFTSCVTDEVVKANKKLFMTATVKIYYVNDEDDDTENEFSMMNEELFGKICYSLTIFDAIRLGILCNFEVYLLEVNDKDIRKMLNKNVNFLGEEVKGRHLATFYGVYNAYLQGARKIVTLYREIADANDFARLFQFCQQELGLFEGAVIGCVASDATRASLGAPYQYATATGITVIGNNKRKAQQWWLKEGPFRTADVAIATSTPWLKEGEDVPHIDCIVFGDRFKSGIDIIQTIGRALRWYPGKDLARIVLPIMQGEANKAAIAIQNTVGSLQGKVDTAQIIRMDATSNAEVTTVVGELEEGEEGGSGQDERQPHTPRWVFQEDQDGITTLVTNNEMTINLVHSSNTSAATRLEHEEMLHTVSLKVTNTYRKFHQDACDELWVKNTLATINLGVEGVRTSVRRIHDNQHYVVKFAEHNHVTIEEANERLAKYLPEFDKLRFQIMFGN
jgi:predicted helicase